MKRNFKRIVALGMALSTLSAASVFAAVTSKLTGSIASADLKVSISIPATGKLTIKPFAKNQVDSGILGGENTSSEVGYKISVIGYTAVAKSKNADDEIAIKVGADNAAITDASTYTGEAKEMSLRIQAIASSAAVTEDDFTEDATEVIKSLSEADYTGAADSEYVKATATDGAYKAEASVDNSGGSNKFFGFRVVGTMNPSAAWTAGDSLTVVPIFKVAPVIPSP